MEYKQVIILIHEAISFNHIKAVVCLDYCFGTIETIFLPHYRLLARKIKNCINRMEYDHNMEHVIMIIYNHDYT